MNEDKKLKQRYEIDNKYKWNIKEMYADDEAWEADFASLDELVNTAAYFEGRLGESARTL